jgi:hypothetical protein
VRTGGIRVDELKSLNEVFTAAVVLNLEYLRWHGQCVAFISVRFDGAVLMPRDSSRGMFWNISQLHNAVLVR